MEKLSLQKEWLIPESIIEHCGLKVIYPFCYKDKRDDKEVFTCFFKTNELRETTGCWQKVTGVYYMQKEGKELTIVYNTFGMDPWGFLFTTLEGEVYKGYTDTDRPFMVARWQFEKGCYIVADYYYDTVYDEKDMEIGKPFFDEYDEENGIISFYEPFEEWEIPKWTDIEE